MEGPPCAKTGIGVHVAKASLVSGQCVVGAAKWKGFSRLQPDRGTHSGFRPQWENSMVFALLRWPVWGTLWSQGGGKHIVLITCRGRWTPTQNLVWMLGLMMPPVHQEDMKRLITHN